MGYEGALIRRPSPIDPNWRTSRRGGSTSHRPCRPGEMAPEPCLGGSLTNCGASSRSYRPGQREAPVLPWRPLSPLSTQSAIAAAANFRGTRSQFQPSRLTQRAAKARARLMLAEEQLQGAEGDFGALAEALSTMLPHVNGDDCPVCQRDFTEVSDTPLAEHVVTRVAALTQQTDRLQALVSSRRQAHDDLRRIDEELVAEQATAMDPDRRVATQAWAAELSDFERRLASVRPEIDSGSRLVEEERQFREGLQICGIGTRSCMTSVVNLRDCARGMDLNRLPRRSLRRVF